VEVRIEHEPGRFVARLEGAEAVLVYELREGVLDVRHTYTPPALRGRGLAARLTRAAFAHAAAHGLTVRPTCSYTRAYLDRHPELAPLAAR
jgi:predicted GNAT family acetyltransferase